MLHACSCLQLVPPCAYHICRLFLPVVRVYIYIAQRSAVTLVKCRYGLRDVPAAVFVIIVGGSRSPNLLKLPPLANGLAPVVGVAELDVPRLAADLLVHAALPFVTPSPA